MNPLFLLLGAGAVTVAAVASSSSSAPPKPELPPVDDPDRSPLWGSEHAATMEVTTRGWYHDVWTSSGDEPVCGAVSIADVAKVSEKCGITCFLCDEREGEATPLPKPFLLRLGKPQGSFIYSVDVRVEDIEGVIAREQIRTVKNTSGRKSGRLDVNEVELIGPARVTSFCERLARAFPYVNGNWTQGEYLTRRRIDCGTELTPAQAYTLYRAQRNTTPDHLVAGVKTLEWFAKVRAGQAYALRSSIGAGSSYRGLYDLRLGLDDNGVYVAGTVAPSLASQKLHIQAVWRTRPA